MTRELFQSGAERSIARRVFARYQVSGRTAKEWPSQEALEQYLVKHPRANKSKHTVKPKSESKPESKFRPKFKSQLGPKPQPSPMELKRFLSDNLSKGYYPKDLATLVSRRLERPVSTDDLKGLIKQLYKNAAQVAALWQLFGRR